jgi:chromosome segregation ATPase
MHWPEKQNLAHNALQLLEEADAAEAKLKRAEEVIKTLTIADDRHFDEMSKRGHRAGDAWAKLKKAKKEIETWKNADISRTLRAHTEHEAEGLAAMLTTTTHRADAAETRVETLEKALRELHGRTGLCHGAIMGFGCSGNVHSSKCATAVAALKEKP